MFRALPLAARDENSKPLLIFIKNKRPIGVMVAVLACHTKFYLKNKL
jgi:hypothetical protein